MIALSFEIVESQADRRLRDGGWTQCLSQSALHVIFRLRRVQFSLKPCDGFHKGIQAAFHGP